MAINIYARLSDGIILKVVSLLLITAFLTTYNRKLRGKESMVVWKLKPLGPRDV